MSLLDDNLEINIKYIILKAVKEFTKEDLKNFELTLNRLLLSQKIHEFTKEKWEHIFNNSDIYYLYIWPSIFGYEIHIDLLLNSFENDEWGFHLWTDKNGNHVSIKKILDLYYEKYTE